MAGGLFPGRWCFFTDEQYNKLRELFDFKISKDLIYVYCNLMKDSHVNSEQYIVMNLNIEKIDKHWKEFGHQYIGLIDKNSSCHYHDICDYLIARHKLTHWTINYAPFIRFYSEDLFGGEEYIDIVDFGKFVYMNMRDFGTKEMPFTVSRDQIEIFKEFQ